MKQIFIHILFFIFCGVTAFSQEIHPDSIISLYYRSDFVFIGKVKGYNAFQDGNDKIIADIDVVEIYKGRRWNKVMAVLAGREVKINNDYLFYGRWGRVTGEKGKKEKAGYFDVLRLADADKDKALPEVKQLVKILKQKIFGRIKSPRAKIVIRKCNCSDEKL